MLNWLLRYRPVLDLLGDEPDGRPTVLDVGSGWHGLARYWQGDVVQTDLYFSEERLPVRGDARYVRATAERLPFADRSFDVVISLDMMEHLPDEIRHPFVQEMARVASRKIILAYPSGPEAQRADRRLARLLAQVPRHPLPVWLEEHLAQSSYPDPTTFHAALPAGWLITSEVHLANTTAYLAHVFLEMFPGGGIPSRLAERLLLDRRVPRFYNSGTTYRVMFVAERIQGVRRPDLVNALS